MMKKEIANTLLNIVGGNKKIYRFYDEAEESSIDIYFGIDSPQEGVTTYGTIGLSDYSLGLKLDGNRELRVELIAACESARPEFGNILSSCAFNIINTHYPCFPGVIYPSVISEYYKNSDMKHILLTTPFLWDDLHPLDDEKNHVTWLMAVPISDKELKYAQEYGTDVLEDVFERKDIDVFDLDRKSAI
ncbi:MULTISPECIES: suppressor of fused domain protein [Bacillota]|jgi:hypothetical protein|uniref:Suppressor of fused domain protein n=2 Tax=Amedibacillus TaxID=2749846 RepID=A0A7G9GTB0_9FIRM|nr:MULTISPECIES: suppressor of fused domain protein [Bacillota]QNM14042.1 suppressor of fused domain protein [[Eubacterium] hominis]MCH4285859.1 suppressor of fused domain protein [Amedibacillus hominis]RGB50219.1 suppressor of fused domain protein [Absiella sp. AM22-9]RGB56990.1 suppressor of fused domain protein [Absiella sp. AM10-20]RGC50715.1 suppressor of fused domain protein [Absiella sp. AM29-15]